MLISHNFQGQGCYLCGNIIEGDGIIAAPPDDLGSAATSFHPMCYEIAWVQLAKTLLARLDETNQALGRSNNLMRQVVQTAGFDIRNMKLPGEDHD